MSRYTTITSNRRTPWAQVQHILQEAPVSTPVVPPVITYFLISGTVTQNGSAPGFSNGIEFPSRGTIFTATTGSYGIMVPLGYGGTAVPHYAYGDFVPQVRVYGSVVADTPNQDYAFTPYPDLHITGVVRLDGVSLSGAHVNLSGSLGANSAVSGTYVGTVAHGYSGVGALNGYALPNYAVSPSSRVYTSLMADQAGQDYNVTTQIFLIQGTITAAGTGQAISLTNGTSVWNSASSGSYGYSIIGGWSGSTVPSYISVPGSYAYGSVTSNKLAQNFDLPVPPLAFSYPNLNWTWSYTLPNHWQIQAQNPASFVWTDTGTAAGTALTSVVTDFGTNYRIYGHNASHAQITPFSNSVAASVVVITGEVQLDGSPVLGAAVSFSGDGQGSSDANGTYFGTLPTGYSGTATLIGYGTDYTVVPTHRVYTSLVSNQSGQDYAITTNGFILSGALTEDGSPMVGIGVEVTTFGTVITNGAGTYSQSVNSGYNGTVIPHYANGSFVPALRTYTNVTSNKLNQDFVFYGTVPIPPTDCPVPSQLYTIPINTDPKNPARNVIDPVNNLLWVIDSYFPNVYYIDVVAGTHLGTLDIGFGVGSTGIVYDAVNQKIVVSSYSGSLVFINPATKAVTYSNFGQTTPAIHCIAVDQAGTIYVADATDSVTGNIYAVSGATEQLIATYPLGVDGIFTYSICWANNIDRLVINNSVAFSTLFYLLDTSNGNFSASVVTSGSFPYTESYYVLGTGHVLFGADNATTVEVVDISAGTDGTIVTTLAGDFLNGPPMRVGDATENTCTNTLLVSDANYGVWEYTMDGNYTLLDVFSNNGVGLNQIGLAHSRATNLTYYESAGTTYSLPYAQYVISGTAAEAGVGILNAGVEFTNFGTVYTDANGSYSGTVPVHWSGTTIPHYVNGSFVPEQRVYSDVTTSQPYQNFEYFWNGYLFITQGITGNTFTNLPNDAVVVNGTIVQLNGDFNVYTSYEGRKQADWTLRGFAQNCDRIVYGSVPNRYVAVGIGGAVWEAEDLSVWYSRAGGVGAITITALAYGGGRFVAAGESGLTTMSTDGTNWTASSAGTLQFSDIFYNGTLFVAVGVENLGQVTCYTSPNGTTWTHRDAPDFTWRAGVYSPELGLNVIVGETGALATSTDAVTWTNYTGAIATVDYIAGITWGNGRFVACDANGIVWSSTNGTVWDYATIDPYSKIGRWAKYWRNDWFAILENFPPS